MTKPERRLYEKEWRRKNRIKYIEKKREYYRQHAEQIKAQMRAYYYRVKAPDRKKHPAKYRELDKLWAQKRRSKFRALFVEIKKAMGNKCSTCGYSKFPLILHFHHLGNKLGNVSELKSFKQIREEAKKCILLCPNCHMELTFVK